MLSKRFWASFKKIIYKEMRKMDWTVESLTYFETLVLNCSCGDNVKYGLLSKHLFKERKNMAVGKGNDKLLEKTVPCIWNKKK